jgi:hypothetical protein
VALRSHVAKPRFIDLNTIGHDTAVMEVTEKGNIKLVMLGRLEGFDGSSQALDDGGGQVLDVMKTFLHRRYVITVSLAGRCPCQNYVHDGREPSDW